MPACYALPWLWLLLQVEVVPRKLIKRPPHHANHQQPQPTGPRQPPPQQPSRMAGPGQGGGGRRLSAEQKQQHKPSSGPPMPAVSAPETKKTVSKDEARGGQQGGEQEEEGVAVSSVLEEVVAGAGRVGVEQQDRVTITVPMTSPASSSSALPRQEWLNVACDRTLDPYRVFHIDVHWLVCSAKYDHTTNNTTRRTRTPFSSLSDEAPLSVPACLLVAGAGVCVRVCVPGWTDNRQVREFVSAMLRRAQNLSLSVAVLPEYGRAAQLNVHPFVSHPYLHLPSHALVRHHHHHPPPASKPGRQAAADRLSCEVVCVVLLSGVCVGGGAADPLRLHLRGRAHHRLDHAPAAAPTAAAAAGRRLLLRAASPPAPSCAARRLGGVSQQQQWGQQSASSSFEAGRARERAHYPHGPAATARVSQAGGGVVTSHSFTHSLTRCPSRVRPPALVWWC